MFRLCAQSVFITIVISTRKPIRDLQPYFQTLQKFQGFWTMVRQTVTTFHLYPLLGVIKTTTFRMFVLLPFSGERRKGTLTVRLPGPRLGQLDQGPNRLGFFLHLKMKGEPNLNVVDFIIPRRCMKSKKQLTISPRFCIFNVDLLYICKRQRN